MKLNFCFPIFSFVNLALFNHASATRYQYASSHDDPIPYGAFPSVAASPASPASPSASPTYTASAVPASSPDTISGNDPARLGRAIIYNNCRFPIYVWSVGSTVGPERKVSRGQSFTETFRRDYKSGGIALKITKARGGLFNGSPQTIFAYNLNGTRIWYDLTDVFGDPFKGYPVSLLPSEPLIFWRNGIPPRGSQIRVGRPWEDLGLTFC